jgi:hypothetical protein
VLCSPSAAGGGGGGEGDEAAAGAAHDGHAGLCVLAVLGQHRAHPGAVSVMVLATLRMHMLDSSAAMHCSVHRAMTRLISTLRVLCAERTCMCVAGPQQPCRSIVHCVCIASSKLCGQDADADCGLQGALTALLLAGFGAMWQFDLFRRNNFGLLFFLFFLFQVPTYSLHIHVPTCLPHGIALCVTSA